MRIKKAPIRTCYICKVKGRYQTYMIWDKDNPKVGTGKRKWWICPNCGKD